MLLANRSSRTGSRIRWSLSGYRRLTFRLYWLKKQSYMKVGLDGWHLEGGLVPLKSKIPEQRRSLNVLSYRDLP